MPLKLLYAAEERTQSISSSPPVYSSFSQKSGRFISGTRIVLNLGKNICQIFGKRTNILEVKKRYFVSFLLLPPDGSFNGTVGASPTYNKHIAGGFTFYRCLWYVVGDSLNFFSAQICHDFMVQRIVTDVTGDILFFKSSDTVLEPGVPGRAQGRANVFSSRAYGWKLSDDLKTIGGISRRSAAFGMRHGSDPLPRYPSVSRMDGMP